MTLPLLRPTILFVVVQATIFSYQIFDIPFLLTRGGPSDASLTLAIYLYDVGFQQFNQGYAAAIGYSLALISIVLAGLQLLLFRVFATNRGARADLAGDIRAANGGRRWLGSGAGGRGRRRIVGNALLLLLASS